MEAYEKTPTRTPVIITVPCGLGARDRGCGEGPAALLSGGLAERLARRGVPTRLGPSVAPASGGAVLGILSDLFNRLAREVGATLRAGDFPLVLGGDHSCAVGTWSGAARALAERGEKPLGLVWIDAHMDAHTELTSHSGMPHGMPLAALLGRGANPRVTRDVASFVDQGPLQPRNVCLVGVRSFEPEELEYIREVGLRCFFMDEVQRRGIAAVLEEAVGIASADTAGYGLSIDMDVVDPKEAPGVGTPAAGGVEGAPLVEALRAVARDPRLVALEMVEYNPKRDPQGQTAALLENLLVAALAVD